MNICKWNTSINPKWKWTPAYSFSLFSCFNQLNTFLFTTSVFPLRAKQVGGREYDWKSVYPWIWCQRICDTVMSFDLNYPRTGKIDTFSKNRYKQNRTYFTCGSMYVSIHFIILHISIINPCQIELCVFLGKILPFLVVCRSNSYHTYSCRPDWYWQHKITFKFGKSGDLG